MLNIAFEKYTLSNGLDVILHEDHSTPVVAVNVWYHVGSQNEAPGRTGFAHLFEHVMFEGSKHHNREYFEPLQEAGANINGSTSADRTNYYENVPSNYLELALWLESDRMGFLLDALDERKLDIQREVVKNERRQNYENRPYGLARHYIHEALYPPTHPYRWLTIGVPEDLDAATLEDVKAFFLRYYRPSNASLALAGDIVPDEALKLVERYFGDLEPGEPLVRHQRWLPTLASEVRVQMEDRVQLPRLYLVWPGSPQFDPLEPPLSLLATILGQGRSSRLYRSLVYEKRVAQEVRVYSEEGEIAGQFAIEVTAAPGHELEELRELVDAELERLRENAPSEEEVARAANRHEADFIRRLENLGGFGGRADMLNYFNVFTGNPDRLNTDLDRYLAVTPEDVRNAARLLGPGRVRLDVLPKRRTTVLASNLDRTRQPPPGAPRPFVPPVPQRRRLKNGMELLVIERRELPVVAAGLLLRAGAKDDPAEQSGLALLTAQMLQEGTQTRSSTEIAEAFEFLGARLFTRVDREVTLLSTEVLTKHWPRALELLADIAQHATFPEREWERVQQEHLTDLRRLQDDAAALAERVAPMVLFGPDTPYGRPIDGTEDSVARLTRDDLRAFFIRNYQPETATFVLVGDISLQQAAEQIEEAFSDWYRSPLLPPEPPQLPPPLAQTTIYLVDRPGAAQSVIRAGHRTIPRHDPDYYALVLVNHLFGGQFSARLNMNLRQAKGYSYGYRSSIAWFRGFSALVAGGGVQTAVTKEAVLETLREFADLRGQRPIEEDEFAKSKANLLQGLPMSFETPSRVLGQAVELVLFDLPDTYWQEFPRRLEAITLEEARRVARERIQSEGLAVLVVGDRSAIEPGLRELGFPIVHLDKDGHLLQ